jgi:hypothetical protein
MIVWSIAQGLAGFVVSYVQFLMVRRVPLAAVSEH